MGMVVIALLVAGLLGVLLALLKRADAPRKAEREHLAGKQMRLVLKALKAAFSVRALAALLGAGIGFGAEVTHWLETGTWAVGKTLGEAWPALAERVAAMQWIRRATRRFMGRGSVAQSSLRRACGRLFAAVVPCCGA